MSELHDAARAATGTRVLNREFPAAMGCRPELLWLLDEWEREGTHAVKVFEGQGIFPSGAVRFTDAEQARAAAAGLSKAPNVDSTAHGPKWRAGLDVHPVGFVPSKDFTHQPGMFELCERFALWAEGKAHPNGTRFRSGRLFDVVAPDGVKGDWVHIEILGWSKLPPLTV